MSDVKGIPIDAEADLPTRYGKFRIYAFYDPDDKKEHVAMVYGNVKEQEDVLCRIHSECLTGEVMGSEKCDCGEQLDYALKAIAKEGKGVVVYLRQEGRGIGLVNKIKAYALQDQGMDTSEANRALGFEDDLRDFHVAHEILAALGVKSIRLMTNNPKKIETVGCCGITINERVEMKIPPKKHNKAYLKTKKEKFGHMLDV